MMKGSFVVKQEDEKKRIDVVLSGLLEGVSRARIQQSIKKGLVRINKEIVKPSRILKAGEMVEYEIPEKESPDIVAQDIPIDVIYEDEHIFVVNKPAGLVVHPAAGHADGTLVNAFVYHLGVKEMKDPRPGLVHRLDKDTSGVMVLAKTEKAHNVLTEAFANRDVFKIYVAIVKGNVAKETFVVENYLSRSPYNRLKFTGRFVRGRISKTLFRRVACKEGLCVILAAPKTGRTHQIRVHLSELGYPIVGDELYGGKRGSVKMDRQALHAWILEIPHPETGMKMRFKAEVAEDMKRLIEERFGKIELESFLKDWP